MVRRRDEDANDAFGSGFVAVRDGQSVLAARSLVDDRCWPPLPDGSYRRKTDAQAA